MASIITNFLIGFGLIWIIGATITDIKKREVPNYLSYSLILIALFARLIYSILQNDYQYIQNGLIYFGIFFVLAYLFYYARVFAGGDAKLLMGIGVILAEPPIIQLTSTFPIALTFLINLLIAGAFWGVISTSFIAYKNKDKIKKEIRKKINDEKINKILKVGLITSILFGIFSIITKTNILITFSLMFLILPYLYLITKCIEKVGMIKKVKPNELSEGDWIVNKIEIGKKEIKSSWEGLTKKDILLLKRVKKEVYIKEGIPFVPAFLIAFLITLLLGNLFEIITKLFF